MKLDVRVLEARMRAPVSSSRDTVDVRPLALVTLTASDGAGGHGEAAPLTGYDGVRLGDALAALEDCRPVLAESDAFTPGEHRELLAACEQAAVLPQAVAAIDLALWDLAGRRGGQPVWALLEGPGSAPAIEVNAMIAAGDRAGAATEAAAARAAGFGCVKLKVGLGDDAGRVAAVRAAAGRDMQLRVDANGAWSVEEALTAMRMLAPAGIELCEEPVSGLEALAQVAERTEVPLALDETTVQPGALETRACDAVCLKISRCGGITGVLDASRRARAAGYEVYLASTHDGPLGIAAALHAAVAIEPDRPCGLATLPLFADRIDPLPARHGRISPPSGPGLGEGLLDWYAD
jgi:L-alanine-DL-glutamate epimerase-like enolase superfamily enzyme